MRKPIRKLKRLLGRPGLIRQTAASLAIAVGVSPALSALERDNPYSPYPPGCATLPAQQRTVSGDNLIKVYEGTIALENARDTSQTRDATIAVYRVACSEPDRSLIWLEFGIPEGVDPSTVYVKPTVIASAGNGYSHYMVLAGEPGGLDAAVTTWYPARMGPPETGLPGQASSRSWKYLLDNVNPTGWGDSLMSPDEYNRSLTLKVFAAGTLRSQQLKIEVPATTAVLNPNPRIPISGRLSGNWVTPGSRDQGFVLSVAELAMERRNAAGQAAEDPMLLFLSWYTFGPDGEQLWLTGSARFEPGDTEVSLLLEQVVSGEFNGSKPAQRDIVGTAVIRANGCNDLSLQYDLESLDLGIGTRRMQRLFSLEIAGHVCRDLPTRVSEVGS